MKKQKTLRALVALTLLLVLAVFFAACEGGYEPSVRRDSISHYIDVTNTVSTLKVTVHVPRKLKYDDTLGYEVTCLSAPERITFKPDQIYETTTYKFTGETSDAVTTITITVKKFVTDAFGAPVPGEIVATADYEIHASGVTFVP